MIPNQIPLSFEDWTAVSQKANFIEFDWVGVDSMGRLGIFSSDSIGYIPDRVFSSYEQYVRLNQCLHSLVGSATPKVISIESGDFNFWIDWAQKGFFAYDYQDIHRDVKFDRYDLIAIPDPPLLVNSISQLYAFDSIIPRFSLTFSGDILFSRLKDLEI